jgi:hypothetical protein
MLSSFTLLAGLVGLAAATGAGHAAPPPYYGQNSSAVSTTTSKPVVPSYPAGPSTVTEEITVFTTTSVCSSFSFPYNLSQADTLQGLPPHIHHKPHIKRRGHFDHLDHIDHNIHQLQTRMPPNNELFDCCPHYLLLFSHLFIIILVICFSQQHQQRANYY